MSTQPYTFSVGRKSAESAEASDGVGTLADAHGEVKRELPDAPPNPVMECLGLNVYYGTSTPCTT